MFSAFSALPVMTNAFVTKTRNHGRRAWKCKGKCCKLAKFNDAADGGKWNNATKMECVECGFKPNTSCILWGDGLGVNGGNGRKKMGSPRPARPSPPSHRSERLRSRQQMIRRRSFRKKTTTSRRNWSKPRRARVMQPLRSPAASPHRRTRAQAKIRRPREQGEVA